PRGRLVAQLVAARLRGRSQAGGSVLMARAPQIRLDHAGMAEILMSAGVEAAVNAKVEQVAKSVRELGVKVGDRDGGPREYDLPVKTSMTTTDRAHGEVTLAHPAGEAVQA